MLLFMAGGFNAGCGEKTQSEKTYRIGVLSGSDAFVDIAGGFKAKMAALGYVEDKNIVYAVQKLNADPEATMRAARQLTAEKVDLILAFPTDTAVVAQKATEGTNIPVVFAMAGIEGNNLVKSISQPGGRVTGIRFPGPELTVKRLELLHEFVPQAKRIYLIYDRNYPIAALTLEGLRSTAPHLNKILVEDPVDNVKGLQAALHKRTASGDIGIDAVLLMPDIVNHSPGGYGAILAFANKHGVPIGGGMDFTADLGALFSYVPGNTDMGGLAAILTDKILNGVPAGTIPVITPESRLRINYKMARKLGLTISEGLLSRADEVIR